MVNLKPCLTLLVSAAFLLVVAVPLTATGETEGPVTTTATAEEDTTSLPVGWTATEVMVITPDRPMATYTQAPELQAMESGGQIPPLRSRLPDLPPEIPAPDAVGKYGGTLRHREGHYTNFGTVTRYMLEALMARSTPRGTHLYGNLAGSMETSDDLTTFTVSLRKGVKWSDGHELTTEDVMFAFEDIQLYSPDPEVTADSLFPRNMTVGGEKIMVSAPDDYTVVLETAVPWADYFNIANMYAIMVPVPAHYLKEFHPKHNAKLRADATAAWSDFENVYNQVSNPERPSLGPWIADTVKDGEFMTLKRNPYYWKVDSKGQQLPYADQLRITYVKDADVLKLQMAAGQYDWLAMGFSVDPVLFQNQDKGNYTMVDGESSQYWAGIKINHGWIAKTHDDSQDQKVAALLKQSDFVKALQLGIDNRLSMSGYVGPELVDLIATTDAHPWLQRSLPVGMNTADPRVQELWDFVLDWMRYDPAEANGILDGMGLKIGNDGFRTHPDGSRIEITAGIFTDFNPLGEVARQQLGKWEKELKIKFFVENKTWSAGAGEWYGREAIAMTQYATGWYDWAQTLQIGSLVQKPIYDWITSDGASGIEPYPEIKDHWLQLEDLENRSSLTVDPVEKIDLATQATEIAIYNHLDSGLWFGGVDGRWYRHNRIRNNPGGVPIGYMRRWTRMEQWWIDE